MKTLGIRSLKQNAASVISRVVAGEVITVTNRGRPVARLVPISVGVLESLIASGRARPARRTFASLGPPPKGKELTPTLRRMRAAERY